MSLATVLHTDVSSTNANAGIYARPMMTGPKQVPEARIAQAIQLDDEIASLQFSGAKGLSTRARVRFLGHPPDVIFSSSILGRAFGKDGTPLASWRAKRSRWDCG